MNPEKINESQYIFVYGTLMSGFGNHERLGVDQLEQVGTGEITGTMFHLGGFPGVIPQGDGRIKGEVYKLDEERVPMSSLDSLEGYHPRQPKQNNFYTRELVDVTLNDATVLTAWVYYLAINPGSFAHSIIESGDFRHAS